MFQSGFRSTLRLYPVQTSSYTLVCSLLHMHKSEYLSHRCAVWHIFCTDLVAYFGGYLVTDPDAFTGTLYRVYLDTYCGTYIVQISFVAFRCKAFFMIS